MNMDLALKIFALGVGYGNLKTRTGFDTSKMSDERLSEILHEGFAKHIDEINQCAKQLELNHANSRWYAENFTAKQAFYFGLLAMFDEYEKIPTDKKGKKELTQETIDKLTQLQFRDTNGGSNE